MSVLSRAALEESPLSDLHTIAAEMGIDGYRRLRKADLINRILGEEPPAEDPAAVDAALDAIADEEAAEDAAAGGDDDEVAEDGATDEDAPKPRRGRRGGRGRTGTGSGNGGGRSSRNADPRDDDDVEYVTDDDDDDKADEDKADKPARARSRGGRGRGRGASAREESRDDDDGDAPVVAGVVELLGNGSGFLRVNPPDASDDDVYISAAQIRRCELVSGDKVGGPVRAPRRSERYPSLIRIDTINEKPADEVAEGTHFDDLPAAFPSERFSLGAEDPTLKAIEWLTPIGRGSRVTITGGPRAGKSEALRLLAGALKGQEGLDLTVVLAGVRPEEVGQWTEAGLEPAASLALSSSADAQAQAVERAVDTAKRVAARGGHAVVLIDTLDHVHVPAARRALAAARSIAGAGSLTVVATSSKPLGGETTVIALDVNLTSTGRFPALDLVASGTLRPDLLVGQAGADAIAQARAAALGA
jgi:transcription termination factor Rho